MGVLDLQTNTPPLTSFPLPRWIRTLQRQHRNLLKQVKDDLNRYSLTISQIDKGHGLIILHKIQLQYVYNSYLYHQTTSVPTYAYGEAIRDLRKSLVHLDPHQHSKLDDRPPTFYFKFKTHKEAFITKELSRGIFLIDMPDEILCNFTRPIVSHKPSITTLASAFLRPLITPIITAAQYLVEDVLEATNLLFFHSPPSTLYCYDIIKFYPSTPHNLIIESFSFYHPHSIYLPLLKSLLRMNYVTNSTRIYTHGTTGIPMGLPLAPELSRMVTAYLLKDYIPPPGEILTIYFDDIASTFPIPLDLLTPYNLEQGPPNRTQDIMYDSTSHSIVPITQPFRQPAPLHLSSNHPSRKQVYKSFMAPVHRNSALSSHIRESLESFLLRYLSAFHRAGHIPSEIVVAITELFYFPTKTLKNPPPDTFPLVYNYSQTRPTRQQLRPLLKNNEEIHLVPKIPLAPLEAVITRSFPTFHLNHTDTICRARCPICHAYEQTFDTSIQFPFEPCWRIRCTYLLHHPYVPHIMYVGQTGATKHVVNQPRSNHRIWKHLQAAPSLRWQIIKPIPTEYQTPTRIDTSLEREAVRKLTSLNPNITFITHDPSQFYAAIDTAVAPISALEA